MSRARDVASRTVPANAVASANIVDGTIVDGDISASAAIAASKLTGVVQASIVTAKGDLVTATGNSAPARLAVGATNGHVLKVNNATATGLEWGSASTSGEDDQVVLAVQVFG